MIIKKYSVQKVLRFLHCVARLHKLASQTITSTLIGTAAIQTAIYRALNFAMLCHMRDAALHTASTIREKV
jgi:hypothetical protein